MKLEFRQDRAGFPLIRIESFPAYLHFLPLTKIQLESFLCSQDDPRFDEGWYNQILQLNPRVSPGNINPRNYHQALASGIQPAEAEAYAEWNGDGMRLPTLDEWYMAYQYLKDIPPQTIDWRSQLVNPKERCLQLLQRMAPTSTSLADQLFLRGGLLEWVELETGRERWGGMGEVTPALHGLLWSPDNGVAHTVMGPEKVRLSYYGARALIPVA